MKPTEPVPDLTQSRPLAGPAAQAEPQGGPLAAYHARVRQGLLDPDAEQERVATRLDALFQALRGRPPHGSRRPLGLARLFGRAAARLEKPRGLYIVGQVGRGKSMLMDMFFACAPVAHKRRIHFHRFMQDVHSKLHATKRSHPEITDPIPPLARSIAAEATLLCFDEFQVNDIADAMILGRLFDALFAHGVTVVATSNTPPEGLFQNRPGGDAFKPFIAIIKREMDTLFLDSERDYRRGGIRGIATWHVPADIRAERRLDAAFQRLADRAAVKPVTLPVMGRKFIVKLAAGPVARFEFYDLCGVALGAGDYLALASRFGNLVIDGIPRLGPENFDVARRFIVLIDALYEQKVKLVASAAAQPDRIYMRGEGAQAFERTASRLEEMQSEAYLELPHLH